MWSLARARSEARTRVSALDYLASAKNLLGCGLGTGAAAATLLTGAAGPWWPVVVAAAYGIGAVAGPRGRSIKQILTTEAVVDVEDLKSAMTRLRDRSVPDEVGGPLHGILGTLDEIVPRWDTVKARPEIANDVTATVADYLPTTLDAYARIPANLRDRPSAMTGTSPKQDVLNQLTVLGNHLHGVRDAVYADDVAALQAQGRFLSDKYGSKSGGLDLS